MEQPTAEGNGISNNEIENYANAMDKSSEANHGEGSELARMSNCHADGVMHRAMSQCANAMDKSLEAYHSEGLEVVGTYNCHADGIMDTVMPLSDQDDCAYIENILAPFEETHEFFEDLECRFTVAAMVADAVTNGMVCAVLEESSEALAAKEAEIIALNDKLEDRDSRLWKLEETLQFKQEELAAHIAESNSDRDRLVYDFMHEKERMQRRLHETEIALVEKEKELAAKNDCILEMATELEVERNKTMTMEEQIQNLHDVEALSRKKISALVEELERAKAEQESVRSLIREQTLKNEPELMERSKQVENLEKIVLERNERISFLERSILSMEKRNSELLQNIQELELAKREETEEQIVKGEIKRCVSNSVYEGHMLELALSRNTLERDRLQSWVSISTFKQEIGHLKTDFEAKLEKKKLEVSDLAEKLEQSKVCNELQGILETFIQESEHQISRLRQNLDSKDKQISSLTCAISCQRLECDKIQAHIASSHAMDAEMGNNLSTLKAIMEIQCVKLKQALEEERMGISDDLSRITNLQLVNNGLAERLREHKLNLEEVEEKLQQWQREIELEFVNQVFGSKLGEVMQLIAVLNPMSEEEEKKLGSHLRTTFALETALNVEKLEVPRLQGRIKGSESLDYNLSGIDLHKIDAAFDKLNAKLLQLAFKLDVLEKTSKMSIHQIQSWAVSFREKLLEEQWKWDFEDEIRALVLSKFLNDLEGHFETKEEEERTQSSTLQTRWDEGRFALMNEISSLRQELELLKIEEPVKSSFISDPSNTNGFQILSRLTQEVKNGEAIDPQRKDWAAKRFSASQHSAGTAMTEKSDVASATGKIAEGHSIRELDLSEQSPAETVDILESPLKSMTKQQLMTHFKRVVAELKREKECIVEKNTEEIYRLKRDFLREKDGFHSKKDKELDALKKRIAEITGKLDKVVEESDKLSVLLGLEDRNHAMVFKLKDELQAEKANLLGILKQKEHELKALSKKLSDALSKDTEHSSTQTCLLKQISELQSEKEEIDVLNWNRIEILSTVFEETVKEKDITLNLVLKEWEEIMEHKVLLEDMMHKKDTALTLSVIEKKQQEQKIALMEKQIEEKENALEKQKAHLESIIQCKDSAIDSAAMEQEELKKQVALMKEAVKEKGDLLKMTMGRFEEELAEKRTLEGIIEEKENALFLLTKKEEEKRKQLEAIVTEKETALILVRRDLEKHEKVIVSLEESLKQRELSLEWAMMSKEEEEQRKNLLEVEVQKLKDAIKNMQDDIETFWKQNEMEVAWCVRSSMDAALELERRVTENIQDKLLRLEKAGQQLKKLCGQANVAALRESYYREKLERKYCNLQKAEEEVDLLGDEVDNLLSLLEKVYAALDHYSPILQHYPGIRELLKLIKRELVDHVDTGLQL